MRSSIPIKLNDGKEYLFSERNRSDADYYALQELLRKHNYTEIQDCIKDKDNQLTLLLVEQKREYTNKELSIFIASNREIQRRFCYDSFKIQNPGIDFTAFFELINPEDVSRIFKLISELESDISLETQKNFNEFLKDNHDMTLVDFVLKNQNEGVDMSEFARVIQRIYKKKEISE